ncbi:MAG TPA: EAL domain-containing protein [Acidimicrobiia bacterium]|jgi:diguanylate cyclase (GGDEF)-like protein
MQTDLRLARSEAGPRDPLTGLASRGALERSIDGHLAHGTRLAVLLLDLDRFKEVNDTLGHLAGDALLRELAARLERSLDPTDTSARFGGDEFAVVLPGVRDSEEAYERATTIRRELARPVRLGDVRVEIEASIGMAIAPDDGDETAALLHRADVAMYEAKRARRGVARYDVAHDPRSDAHLAFASALHEALTSGAIVVHYQPIARFDGTVVRVEALARWHHAQLGMIEPSRFILGAEQSGLIGRLTDYVLDQALHDARRWRAHGHARVGVAVNVAAANLVDGRFPARVAALLAARRLPAAKVTLELREASVPTLDRARVVLDDLAGLGVRLSVDDFGRAPSSLTMLPGLRAHEVKLDRAVVQGLLNHSGGSRRLAAAIIAASHALGLTVVAKGVEAAPVWDGLADLQCDAAQGFHLCRPLPADDLLQWLRRRAM